MTESRAGWVPGASVNSAELLVAALRYADEAAGLLLRDRASTALDPSAKSTPTDVVTVLDKASERLIVERLQQERPRDGVLGEEGSSTPGQTGIPWIIDPIDGTVNFMYGLPVWAVSIAAEVDGVVEAGVVHLPVTGEVFAARRGLGATLNGDPIRVSSEVELSRALVSTGFGYAAHRRAAQGRIVANLLPVVRDIRRIGASAPDLCYVACGRVDGYYERGLYPWDFSAAALIAREAGARVEGLHGVPAGPELLVAAPPPLFDAFHDMLAQLGADRD